MILRRALTHYLDFLESISENADELNLEHLQLKNSAGGDEIPWPITPDFSANPAKPFSKYLLDAEKKKLKSRSGEK